MTFAAQIASMGDPRMAEVFPQQEDGADGFNNTQYSYPEYPSRRVLCVRTYPNRNTEVVNRDGSRERDRPLFIFPDDENNDPPDPDARVRYPAGDGIMYGLQSPTRYPSHIEIFGEVVEAES